MLILIDISDAQVKALDALAKRRQQSHASLVGAAIDDYLQHHQHLLVDGAFGLWGKYKVDGLAYQEYLRKEW
ncbi:MAG: CopG family transcriptional regulator [Pseudomonadales bacterium]|jgi:hypothetical protein|nr:CopG family transcriptional regulator [Pseudomonadales bacterium]